MASKFRILVAVLGLLCISAQAQNVPPPSAPESHRTFDRTFITTASLLGASAIADAETTRAFLSTNPNAYERDPWMGRHPSTARVYGLGSLFVGGNILACYELKKHHVKWWWVPLVAETAFHSILATNNGKLIK